MTPEAIKKQKARDRAAAWRRANPERFKEAIARCKAAKPLQYDAARKRRYQANRAAMIAKSRAWRLANPDRYREQMTTWTRENLERRREIANTWRKNNPEKVNPAHAKRRAAKVGATPAWANDFFIKEAYHLANLRSKLTGYKWHVDHIVPLQSAIVCGLHVENNLRVIPASVNQSKNNRHWPDMP
jgi:hypothetical protein